MDSFLPSGKNGVGSCVMALLSVMIVMPGNGELSYLQRCLRLAGSCRSFR